MSTDCNIRISKSTHALLLTEAKRSRRAIKEIIAELVEKYLIPEQGAITEQDREPITIDFVCNKTNYKVMVQIILGIIQEFQNVDVKVNLQDKSILGLINYPLQHFVYKDGKYDFSYMQANSFTLRDLIYKSVKCNKLLTIKVIILDLNIGSPDKVDIITDVIKGIETHSLTPTPPDFDAMFEDASKISSSVASVASSYKQQKNISKDSVSKDVKIESI